VAAAAGLAAAALLFVACGGPSSAPPSPPASTPGAPAPATAAPAPGGAHAVTGTAPRASNNGVVIVTLTPGGEHDFPPSAETPEMDQVNLTFVPAVLLVRTGEPVKFLNNDDTLHNVRVREEATREGAFNVAIPTGGDFTYTFPRDGFYIVGCDIHPGMAAAVFAASTPYAVLADTAGAFRFPDVEPGAYTLEVFAGEERFSRDVDVSGPSTVVTVARTPPGPAGG
jgi:plastocyanin